MNRIPFLSIRSIWIRIGASVGLLASGCHSLPTAPTSTGTPWESSSYSRYDEVAQWQDRSPPTPTIHEPLTLDVLQAQAVTSNPVLQQRLQQARQSEALLHQVMSAWFPTADLGANVGTRDSDASSATSNRLTTTTFGPQASLSWLLLDFGNRSATVRTALLETLAANHRFNQAFQDVLLEVHVAYYDLLGAQAFITASQTNLATAATTLDAATLKESGGLGTRLDMLRAKTDYEQSRSQLESACTAEAAAKSRLAAAVGWPASTPMNVILPQAKLPDELDWTEERIEEEIQQALAQRPHVAAARLAVRAAEQKWSATRAERYPRLTGGVQAEQTESRYSDSLIEDRHSTEYSAQLALTFNVFDGRLTAHRIRAAAEALEEARQREQEIELEVGKSVWDRYYELRSAIRQLGFSRAALDSAEEAFAMTDERYRSGLCDIVFLLDVQNSLSSARRTWIAAVNNVFVAQVRLKHATGTLGRNTP